MAKYIYWTLAILGGAVAILALVAATRPDDFRVERSINIAASPEKLFPMINEIRVMDTWNPFARQDGVKSSYSGPAAGPGATNAFSGSGGTGKLVIVESRAPSEVVMRLDMEKPLAGSNRIVFSIAPAGAGKSRVTWEMSGKMHYVAKLIGVVVSMDRMIGGQFEKGLRDLKTIAEKK
jgi:hypothetical protein